MNQKHCKCALDTFRAMQFRHGGLSEHVPDTLERYMHVHRDTQIER